MHTLSGPISTQAQKWRTVSSLPTYVMCFIEYNDRVFGHLLGDLLRHFRVEKVVVGVDDDIDEWHLGTRNSNQSSITRKGTCRQTRRLIVK